MGLAVLVLFWVAVGFSFFVLSAGTAMSFTAFWFLGVVVASNLHIAPYFFLTYEALLAATLCIMLKSEWS